MDCSNYFCPKEVFEYIRIEGLFNLNDFRTDKNTNPKIVKALKEEIKILNREKSAKKNNYPNANKDHNYQKRKGVKRWNRSNYKNL